MHTFQPAYPTNEHEQAAAAMVNCFAGKPDVAAVLFIARRVYPIATFPLIQH